MRGSRLVSVCLVAALAHGPALAQPEDEQPAEGEPAPPPVVKDPKVAKKWQQTGATLVTKGDGLAKRGKADDARVQYENAKTAYEKALEAGAAIDVSLELANVLDKLGKHDEAFKLLRVVTKDGSGVKPDTLKKAKAKADDVSTKIGLVTIVVKPEGAMLSIGGNEIGTSPLAEPLVLMPGTYKIAFAANGFQPKETEINVEAGSESERTIELEPIPITVAPPQPNEPEEPVAPPPPSGPSKVPLFVGGGAAVALFGAATVTGLLAKGKHDTFVGVNSTADERDAAKTSGKKLALVTDICLVGGIAAAGFTAFWYFTKYKSASAAETSATAKAKLEVAPWVQGDSGGLTVLGSF